MFTGKALTIVCTDLSRSTRFYADVLGARADDEELAGDTSDHGSSSCAARIAHGDAVSRAWRSRAVAVGESKPA